MGQYTMTCTCGDTMKVDAQNRDQAVVKIKAMMTEAMVAQHMGDKHPGQAVPSQAQVAAMIEQGVSEVK